MNLSIITVTKNNKAGLLRAIECVRNQSYKNIEHLIIDGGSTNGSVESIKNEQLKIKNLEYISEPDEGIYDAINKGIKLAKGDIIGLLHSDDIYADEHVLTEYANAFSKRNVDAVYSDLVYVTYKIKDKSIKLKDKTDIQSYNYSILRYWKAHKSVSSNKTSEIAKDTGHNLLVTDHLLKTGWMPPHPTLFVRKEIFEKYGYYRTDMKIAADYEMILRLLYKNKITSYYLPVTTYLMTIGGASNKSLKNIFQKSKEDYRTMRINGINYPLFTLIGKNFRKLPQFLARDLSQ